MKQLTAIVIGAGGRGKRYTDIMGANPDLFKVVGVAEPIDDRREYIKNKHGVDDDKCFTTWETILNQPKMADIAINNNVRNQH